MSDLSRINLIVDKLPIYDGSENLGEHCPTAPDLLCAILSPEVRQPAIAAGVTEALLQQLNDPGVALLDRWVKFQPYWERILNCSPAAVYAAAIRLMADAELSPLTIDAVNRLYNESDGIAALSRGGITRCVVGTDIISDGLNNEIFCPVFNIENFICPECERVCRELEKLAVMTINGFDDWLRATELAINKLVVNGISALRISIPLRTLSEPTREEAETAFKKLTDGNIDGKETFCRWMIRHVMRLCQHLSLCVQLRNVAIPDYAEARTFFLEYHKVRFDIITDRFLYHVKYLPNVYWNMGRLCAFKPCHAVRLLAEAFLEIPVHKISLIGGGFYHPWPAAGAATRTRRLLSVFLYSALRQGAIDEKRLEYLARLWLYDNPAALYESKK